LNDPATAISEQIFLQPFQLEGSGAVRQLGLFGRDPASRRNYD
jgi:hypothetical protein